MSTIPPRTENCATSSTIGTCSNPTARRCADERLEPVRAARFQFEARGAHHARQARALEHGARGRDEHAHFAAREALERLHALARDLDMRLDLAESFARRIQRGAARAEQRVEIREPALRLGDRRGDHHEHAPRPAAARERGGERGVARAGQPAGGDARARRGERGGEPREHRERVDRVEQRGEH